MSSTPLAASSDAKVRFAFHLSNVPVTDIDAFTKNLTELCSIATAKVGAVCTLLAAGTARNAVGRRNAIQIVVLLAGRFINVPLECAQAREAVGPIPLDQRPSGSATQRQIPDEGVRLAIWRWVAEPLGL